jgi:integrase
MNPQKGQKGYTMKPEKRGKPKQHGNSQGTVYLNTARGYWMWQVSLGYDAKGKAIRASGRADTKTKAEAAKSKAIAERDGGTIAAPDRVTVSEYCKQWLDNQRGVRPKTIEAYKWELGLACETLGRKRMQEVQPQHIKALRQTLENRVMKAGNKVKERSVAATTLRRVEARLKAVFKDAKRDRIITYSPLEDLKPSKAGVPKRVGVALDRWQVEQLITLGEALQAFGLARFWGVLYCMLSVGLRSGEALGLRWQDVDFDKNTIHICHTNSSVKGQPVREEKVKTHHSKRMMQMTPSLRAKLLQQRDTQDLEKAKAGSKWVDTGAVFTTETGAWFHSDGLGRALASLLEWCKPSEHTKRLRGVPIAHRAALKAILEDLKPLPHITPHDLRHTAASIMVSNGLQMGLVSETLGHASLSITSDTYTHVLASDKLHAIPDHMVLTQPKKPVTTSPLN